MNRKITLWSAVTGLVFLFVWQQLQAVRTGYEVEKTHKLIDEQKQRNAYLRLAVEQQSAPAELGRAAQERLKMGPPSPDAVIVLEPSSGSLASFSMAQSLRGMRWTTAALRLFISARPASAETGGSAPGEIR